MSSTLKLIVTISIWILFALGCLSMLVGALLLFVGSGPIHPWALGMASLILAIIGTWFRKQID